MSARTEPSWQVGYTDGHNDGQEAGFAHARALLVQAVENVKARRPPSQWLVADHVLREFDRLAKEEG